MKIIIQPSGSYRVYRGGGWSGDPVYARVALRLSNDPGYRNGGLGLRLIVEVR